MVNEKNILHLSSIFKLHHIDTMIFLLFHKKKIILTLLVVLAMSLLLSAQNAEDYKIFTDAAQGYSVLYRGELSIYSRSKKPNDGSTSFAFSANFEKGDIIFCGKQYLDVILNLNAHTDELCVIDPVIGLNIIVNKNFVDSFSMGSRQFVHFKEVDNPILSNGYYEVLYSGGFKLYKKNQKQYFENTKDGLYIKKGFTLVENFYLCKNDKWYRIASKRDLKKLYVGQAKIIDQLQRKRELGFSISTKERAFVEIVTYLDQP